MQYVIYAVLGLLVLFLAIILIRAAAFRPKKSPHGESTPLAVDEKGIIARFVEIIRCKTISYVDVSQRDDSEFNKLYELLPKLYPNVHKTCEFERVDDTGLLFLWRGKSSAEPTVLMAHYDVVPVNEELWEKPPFEGIVEDGVIWGRGTLDTKVTFVGTLEAVEKLIGEGFVPENDIYLSFSGDEEVAGMGAPSIVELLRSRGVTPQLVIDEGGAVVRDIFPGVTAPCALIGIGEKGIMDLELKLSTKGGHSSAPPPHTAVGQLAKAAVAIEKNPFKVRLTPPVAQMFDTLGRHSTFVYRLIFANLWCFMPVLDSMCKKKGGELNALMRTTCALTQSSGSNASNILPLTASMVANLRLNEHDSAADAVEYLKKTVNDPSVEFNVMHFTEASKASDTDSRGWRDLMSAVSQTWPEAIVSPYLMIAASDSRHFCKISNKVMRFSAMALTSEERGYIHANNERIKIENLIRSVEFYVRLISLR